MVNGYKSPCRLDISDRSGGLLVYVKEGLPFVRLKGFKLPDDIQIIPIEIRLSSSKWIIVSIYRPPKQNLGYFLSHLSDMLDFYNHEKCIVMGDFNTNQENSLLSTFIESQILHNHVNFKTCFKSVEGSCIDLILSNQKHSLQLTGSLDTGMSDFHLLIYTLLKSTYIKLPPKQIMYRNFKNFSAEKFYYELKLSICRYNIIEDYDIFETVYTTVLDKHAPWKSKIVRGNEKPHMNKALKKAIMKRSKLWNTYRKSSSSSDLSAYREQRNIVTKMNKKAKTSHFIKAIENEQTNPKSFWKLCKPFISNKYSTTGEISIKHNGSLIHEDDKISDLLNVYFNNMTDSLNLFAWNKNYCCSLAHPVLDAINKFRSHPSIMRIKSTLVENYSFKFRKVSPIEVHNMIQKLDNSKKTSGQISNKILKISSSIISPIIASLINTSFNSGIFPDKLKLAEITPVLKSGNSQSLGDYRPISILPAISKLFEKAMAVQINSYFDKIFSNLLCGFRKKHSTQHALLQLLRSWPKYLDEGKIVGTVLMDLSKAYDCLPHDLLIAKLSAYGFDFNSLCLIHDYLSNRYHRVRIGNIFSEWLCVKLGVPQGSILGPLLFNIFINDMFLFIKEASICNFADDNSLYAIASCQEEVLSILEREVANVLDWFKINSMSANPEKFQLMFLGRTISEVRLKIGDVVLTPSIDVKLLGVYIDKNLTFKKHVQYLCKKASNKTKALLRIRPFLNTLTAKRLFEAFILSNFNYCPLIWMYGCKSNNVLINKIHKRALSTVYLKFDTSLEALLEIDNSVSVHVRHLRFLLVEVYKTLNRENPEFLWDMFVTKHNSHFLRSGHTLTLPKTKSIKFGQNSISFRGSLLWNNLSNDFKSLKSVDQFKRKIKNWPGNTCTCYICK